MRGIGLNKLVIKKEGRGRYTYRFVSPNGKLVMGLQPPREFPSRFAAKQSAEKFLRLVREDELFLVYTNQKFDRKTGELVGPVDNVVKGSL